MSLISRVRTHCRGQGTSGQKTLMLTGECLDHWANPEINDWTPMAALIGFSEKAQSRMVRAVVGRVVRGYTISTLKSDHKKYDPATNGVRFIKKTNENQGFDIEQRQTLADMVESKPAKSIQSAEVKLWATPKKETATFDLQSWADRIITKGHKEKQTLSAMHAALDAAEVRYQRKQAKKS